MRKIQESEILAEEGQAAMRYPLLISDVQLEEQKTLCHHEYRLVGEGRSREWSSV